MRRYISLFACIALFGAFGSAAFALDARRDIVDRAREYVGCAYSRGGTRPPEFDCSGFVGYIMRPFAPKLPRLSHDMAGFGTKVDKASLRPGDLVFFATTDVPGAVSHVAIFIGDGSIIHAISDGPERGVRITPLDARYWKTHYHSAIRVLSEAEQKTDTSKTGKASNGNASTGTIVKDETPPVANAATRESSPWDTWNGYVMGDYAQWREQERAKLEAQERAYDKDKERNDFEAWKKTSGE